MSRDYTLFLWLFKLGVLPSLYFLLRTATVDADTPIVAAAQVFFVVSVYRCLFPVRYEHYVVLHDSRLSSIFITRLLATFAEVAFIFLLARVLWDLNASRIGWVDGVAWFMMLQIVISQMWVWLAILVERFDFYFYEEFGWVLIFIGNTVASAYLYLTADNLAGREILLVVNLVFGPGYLAFQVFNLRAIRANARQQGHAPVEWTWQLFASGLRRSIRMKNRRTDANAWGGIVGLIWMTGYWVTALPLWVYFIVRLLSPDHAGPQ